MTDSTTLSTQEKTAKTAKVTFAEDSENQGRKPTRKESAPKFYEAYRKKLVIIQRSFEGSLETVPEDKVLELEKED